MARRILLLNTDLEIGGTPTVVRELALRLRDPQTHVEVACLSPWGPVADQLTRSRVRVTALDAIRPWHLPRTVRRLRQLLVEHQIDTVVSFLLHANFVATLAVRDLATVRLVQSIQTTQPDPSWHWWLQGRIHLSAQTILVPSKAIARAASRRSGIAPERFTIIPNAIDPETFAPVAVFQNPTMRVGFLGRIDPVKRVEIAIQAVSRLPDARLEIFGDGPQRRLLEQKHRNHAGIAWHGAVDRPQEALGRMDVLLLPSLGEGFGLVLIEAMASGVPVVASDAGAIAEVVEHEQSGLLVAPGPDEVGRLAVALERVRWDRALRQRLIEGGRQRVGACYTWPAALPRYRALLGL